MSRIKRWIALVFGFIVVAGLVPANAAAEQTTGSSFESVRFGFSVEWDAGDWVGTAYEYEEAEGVELRNELSIGSIFGMQGAVDNETCVTRLAAGLHKGENSEPRVAPRDKQRTGAPAGAATELFNYRYDNGIDNPVEMVLFAGCIQIAEGAGRVQFFFVTPADTYWRMIGRWDEVTETIAVEREASDVDDVLRYANDRLGKVTKGEINATATGIDGNAYANIEYGFGVTWDGEIWTPREVDDENDSGVELSPGASLVTLSAVPYDLDPDRCLSALASGLSKHEAAEDFEVAADPFERPELAAGAAGELYTFHDATVDLDTVMYLECRELPEDGAVLAMRYVAPVENYDTELAEWQALLDSVETD